jgi:hypothetical protein
MNSAAKTSNEVKEMVGFSTFHTRHSVGKVMGEEIGAAFAQPAHVKTPFFQLSGSCLGVVYHHGYRHCSGSGSRRAC